jgi:hypothetical protein
MCSINIDEPTTNVNYCVPITSLGTFFEKLNRLHTHARCTVHEMTPLNGRSEVEETPVIAMVWRHQGYKFTLHLTPIIISHPSLLLALGFFPLLSSANHRWRTREVSSVNALPP